MKSRKVKKHKKSGWMKCFKLRKSYPALSTKPANSYRRQSSYSLNGHSRKTIDGHKNLNGGQRRAMSELPREV